ncbi:MAG: hypothetical protein POG24_09145, partial [Acidocella sp.]|nr:hypothetical protein [Acidocella sp.]
MSTTLKIVGVFGAVAVAAVLFSTLEHPPVHVVQGAFRGTGIDQALGHRQADVAETGETDRAARARALDLLGEVGIPDPADRLDDYPHPFSGGMRQRVMIA